MKLSTRLALLAAVALIPMVIFSGIALKKLLDSHREEGIHSIRETARATSLIIDRELKSAQSALRVLATSPRLADGNWERFYEQAKVANVPVGPGSFCTAKTGARSSIPVFHLVASFHRGLSNGKSPKLSEKGHRTSPTWYGGRGSKPMSFSSICRFIFQTAGDTFFRRLFMRIISTSLLQTVAYRRRG